MRIIHIVNSLRVRAGTELFVSELCSVIKHEGHVVTLVSLHDNPDKSIKAVLDKNKISLICLQKSKKIDINCSKKLKKIIFDFKPDIINIHEGCLLSYFLAFGFKKQSFSLVKSVHCSCEKDLRGGDKLFQGLYVKKRLISFICDSNAVKDTVLNHYKNNVRAVTCHAGTALKKKIFFDYEGPSNPDIRFVCVARFYPIKNHAMLIMAFLDYLKNHPKSELVLIGKGPELEKCKKIVDDHHANQSVIFLGERTNISECLENKDVFVLASKYEGLGISVLEAFAACLPVMVSDVGGLKDLVVDNDNGYCFDPFSRQSISDCMQRVFENKHSLINFAKKSYDKFDMFTIYQSYLEYFEEYNFLLNERDV